MKELFDNPARYERALRLVESKIAKTSDCHLWCGPVKDNGYGQITLTVAPNRTKNFYAHRLIYTLKRGTIPAELEIHHTCWNRRCVNPEHLTLVTHQENMQLMSPMPRILSPTCRAGHEFTDKNTLWTAGRRVCRECKRERERKRRQAEKTRDCQAASAA